MDVVIPQAIVALYYDNGNDDPSGAQYTLIPGSELVYTLTQSPTDLQRQSVNIPFTVPALRRILCVMYLKSEVPLDDTRQYEVLANFRGSLNYAT